MPAIDVTPRIYELPKETVEASNGFSLDIGGSTAKLVYRAKEDYENGKPKRKMNGDMGRVRLIHIARERVDDLITFIKDHVDMKKSDEKLLIYTTGIGGNFFKTKLEKELGVTLKNLMEFDCFVKAFSELCKFSGKESLIYPPSPEGRKIAMKELEMFKLWQDKATLETKFQQVDLNEKAESDELFPCLIIMCGSGVGFMKIDANGSHTLVDGTFMGGRLFLGLSKVLTGEKEFDKLYSMVEESDGRSVDTYTSDVVDVDGEDDYFSFGKGKGKDGSKQEEEFDMRLFPFGKTIDQPRDKIKNADLTASTFRVILQNISHLAHLSSVITKVPRIYFCGNLVNSEKAREFISIETIRRNQTWPEDKRVQFGFVKNGGHLGAMGAFMQFHWDQQKEAEGPSTETKPEAQGTDAKTE